MQLSRSMRLHEGNLCNSFEDAAPEPKSDGNVRSIRTFARVHGQAQATKEKRVTAL
jgi:hypothetical protein